MPYEGAKDGKHYWLTPPDLMADLDREFHFDFDPCPYPKPDDFDGLTAEWGKSNYVNPPFKGPTAWVRKAIEEYKKGKKVVFVFPIDKWIHLLLEAGARVRNLKDVRWCATEDGSQGNGTGRWIAGFILDPERKKEMPDAFTDLVREMRILQQIPREQVNVTIITKRREYEKKVDAALKEIDDAAHAGSDPQLAMSFDEI